MNPFRARFRRKPEVETEAPGRVNLIGEHTDYNQGLVLPVPLPCATRVALATRSDREVHAVTANLDPTQAAYTLGSEARRGDWLDYVQAVTATLASEGFALEGFDAGIDSDVPIGAGLSSSAALAVALLRALRKAFHLDLDDRRIAELAQRGENQFVGARVGIMDPMVASLGKPGHALFLDTRYLTTRDVLIPASMELVVIDSGTGHRIAAGEYNQRREECERAARTLGVNNLREAEWMPFARLAALPGPLGARARHVITENQRVREAVETLEDDDPETLGRLLDEAHRSLRDNFEVSTPGIERLRDALTRQHGVLGARLTGGGFGGSVVAIARASTAAAAARGAKAEYDAGGGPQARIVLPLEAIADSAGFRSFFMGGFEGSTHCLRNGRRLDMIAATRHDEFTAADYRRMMDHGLKVARDTIRWHVIEPRPGEYDWSSARTMVRSALATGIQVIWDLIHFGWPDHVHVFDASFPERFARFAHGFAEVLEEEGDPAPAVAPVNEISFLSFAGGEAGFFNPFARGRGDELKRQLVSGSIAAGRAVRSVLPGTRLVHTDPVIRVAAHRNRPQDRDAAAAHEAAQFHAWDAIAGRVWPELGGATEFLDILGVNYYVHNQWYFPGGHGSLISPSSPEYRPLHQLLIAPWKRYQRPLFIAETGIEDEARPAWLEYVAHEARVARRRGAQVQGLCLYPILNHPGWEDERHCHNGLWDYASKRGEREPYGPLIREIERQQERMSRVPDLAAEEDEALRALRSLDTIAASIAEATETSREA